MRSFRDLIAWQLAKRLTKSVYEWSDALPAQERFGLVAQMRRAAVSVASNIAEGYGVGSRPGFLRHLRIARGSLAELDTQVELAHDLLGHEPPETLHSTLAETARVLQGLIMSLERDPAGGP